MAEFPKYFYFRVRDTYGTGVVLEDASQEDVVEVIRCANCKHYFRDWFEKVNDTPIIVAHEICKRWGEGCKTSESGYCFMGERKEENNA